MLHQPNPDLLVEERRRRICELLRREGRVTVEALATRFGTSQVTIRADLSALESAGALTRTHGGAIRWPSRTRMSRSTSSSCSITRRRCASPGPPSR